MRRTFLSKLIALPFAAAAQNDQGSRKPLKIMMKSAWGSDDPTKAAFPFLHGLALEEMPTHALDHRDPAYPVIVAARAVKPPGSS